jgi:hypothetical protein
MTMPEMEGLDGRHAAARPATRVVITQPELPTDVEYVRVMSLHKTLNTRRPMRGEELRDSSTAIPSFEFSGGPYIQSEARQARPRLLHPRVQMRPAF